LQMDNRTAQCELDWHPMPHELKTKKLPE